MYLAKYHVYVLTCADHTLHFLFVSSNRRNVLRNLLTKSYKSYNLFASKPRDERGSNSQLTALRVLLGKCRGFQVKCREWPRVESGPSVVFALTICSRLRTFLDRWCNLYHTFTTFYDQKPWKILKAHDCPKMFKVHFRNKEPKSAWTSSCLTRTSWNHFLWNIPGPPKKGP